MMDAEDNKKEYELAFLLKEEADLKPFLDIVKQYEAEVFFEGPVKKTALAYEIGKQTSAYFGFIRFTAPAARIPEMNHTLTLKGSALRFLIVNFVPSETPVSSQMPVSPMSSNEPTAPVAQSDSPTTINHSLPLSNEDLEKKIEEILK